MLVVSHCLLLCRVRTREFVPSRIRTSHFHPRYRFPEPTHFRRNDKPQGVCNRFDSARYCHSHKRSPLRLSLIGVFRWIVYKRGRIVLELVYPAIVKRFHRSHRLHRHLLYRSPRLYRSHRLPVLFFFKNVFVNLHDLFFFEDYFTTFDHTVCFYQQISVLLYRVTKWVPEFFLPKF